MQITVEFPYALIRLMIQKQKAIEHAENMVLSTENIETLAFMAGYNAGIQAFSEEMIEELELAKSCNEISQWAELQRRKEERRKQREED